MFALPPANMHAASMDQVGSGTQFSFFPLLPGRVLDYCKFPMDTRIYLPTLFIPPLNDKEHLLSKFASAGCLKIAPVSRYPNESFPRHR
jgi:hypothetical protein